jgi:putative redox protein
MRRALARRRQGYEHEVGIRNHRLIVDEPEDHGGSNAGPRPTELLAASLATCTAITIEMYAERKEWDLGRVEVAVEYGEPSSDGAASFKLQITLPAQLSEEQRERIRVIAGKCPVHRTLRAQDVKIEDSLA